MNEAERTTHTPGPLVVKSRLVRWGPNTEPQKSAVRYAILRQEDGAEVGVARKRGDAELWATAPEMLAVLQALVKASYDSPPVWKIDALWRDAEDVIKRIQGGGE